MASKYSFPPGPTSTSDIDITAMHKALVNHRQKFGEVSYFKIGGRNIVSLNTVEAIRKALNSESLMDRVTSFSQKYLFPDNVSMSSYSDDWSKLRDAFRAGITSTQSISEEMQASLNIEFSYLQTKLKETNGSAFNPRELFSCSVINLLILSMIGRRFDYDHDIFYCFERLQNNAGVLYGSPRANYILTKFPWLRHMICGYGRNYALAQDAIDDIVGYLLYDVKREGDFTKTGIIYEMLRIQRDDPSITDQKIIAVILDIYIAGIITIKSLLLSLVYQLQCNPEIRSRMQEEIDSVISDDTLPNVGHLQNLSYTQAVVLEVLRHCPVAPGGVTRCNSKDATVCGYHFPPHTIFVPNIFGVNHDEEVWVDAWTLDPTRFLNDDGSLISEEHPRRQSLFTFGGGSRACLGQYFAWPRILLYVINLFKKFDIHNDVTQSLCDGDPMRYTRDIVIFPAPFMITARERST